jgi:hypothetical protein
MSDLLKDLAKKGTKILTDTKTPRQATVKGTSLPEPKTDPSLDPHQAAVKRFIKEKPHKKHIIDFFEKVIEAEERLL